MDVLLVPYALTLKPLISLRALGPKVELTTCFHEFWNSESLYSLLYARYHKPLLIASRSWIQAIYKDRIYWKKLLKNKEMVFENGVKNIQAAAYNGARTVYGFVW